MNASWLRRVGTIEQELGLNAESQANAVDAEWIIIFRMRLEGVSVWAHGGGHVGWPLDFFKSRRAWQAMLAAQDEKYRKLVRDSFEHCLKNDPYMYDANYPLLEYYLWTVLYISVEDRPFRPLAIPVELCDWLQSLKPEEYLHYRPIDWCYECGYRYPALPHGIGHDARRFLITRYSEDELRAMQAPFRGKACLVCGGEIMSKGLREKSQSYQPQGVRWFEDSPAGRLLEAKREEWNAEINDLELEGPQYYLAPQGESSDIEDAAEKDFKERRARRPMIRIEHKPSVDDILDLWRRHGR